VSQLQRLGSINNFFSFLAIIFLISENPETVVFNTKIKLQDLLGNGLTYFFLRANGNLKKSTNKKIKIQFPLHVQNLKCFKNSNFPEEISLVNWF